MDLTLDLTQELTPRVSPTLIAVNHILALSSQELQTLIKQEAEENPALDLVERQTCRVCGETLKNGICQNCTRAPAGPAPTDQPDDLAFREFEYKTETAVSTSVSSWDDEFDPVSLVAAEPTLTERLMLDLMPALKKADYRLAAYVVGSLDERGFLTVEPQVIAQELDVPVERVERVLRAMQRVGPLGIGARNPHECLLLQLDHLERERGEVPPHVREILEEHFTELGEHKYAQIAHKLGITPAKVEEARNYIRTTLTPYPVVLDEGQSGSWGRPSKAQYIAPDVIIKEVDGELIVEVVESRRFFMSLNPIYGQMAQDSNGTARIPGGLSTSRCTRLETADACSDRRGHGSARIDGQPGHRRKVCDAAQQAGGPFL